jgi:hypothetical protein
MNPSPVCAQRPKLDDFVRLSVRNYACIVLSCPNTAQEKGQFCFLTKDRQ